MITGTNGNEPKISDKTTKGYYVILDDGEPVGVCTTYESARTCLIIYANDKKSMMMHYNDAFVYSDSNGVRRFITMRKVPRMKIAR